MPMRPHPKTIIAAPLVLTALTAVVVGALYFVAGIAGVGIFAFALSAPFAIWFIWTARNVETIADQIAASTRRAALAPAHAAATSSPKGV